ncbi:hypothetical protein [Sphingomonas astaxanthinifaciens]|uniref:Uncharacterized protein n=1 Tax=Sphingomonas astaxanthinifaciens DSM 22298 TaxID=1123267 RepID=A0ABQ5Z6A0_9SPHN|nr:hypothetical protein [Sphingomonas astaxanthinifaciens]GLR47066.1 hypothetical protein GCM10007925_07770 [Sphingomonas astaxanthinifaciens DSM 22298]
MILLVAALAAATATPTPSAWVGHYQQSAEAWRAGKRDDALRLFYVGQLRGRINVACVAQPADGGPALLGALNDMLGTEINGWAGGEPDRWMAGIAAALAWDAANPDPDSPGAACETERATQRKGLAELRTYIDTHRAEIADGRRENGLAPQP